MKFRHSPEILLLAILAFVALVQALPAPKQFHEEILQRSTIGSTQPHSYFIIIEKRKDEGDKQMVKLEKRVCYGSCGAHAANLKHSECTAINHCRQ